ncbi:hypothetical protein HK101_006567 [Irineochytrium annulatum]|nr:hypothetical protein HK101_006567 [Irineochytrium annulatum]
MVFESLVASVVNKFLGDYVANLETKQLSIGIWQGDVVLHNLRLRREALDKFNLPVDVLEGYLGDLTLSIPWSDLKNKPVRVFINNVYLLASPKADTDYDPVVEDDRAFKLKMEKIETAEMLSAKDKLPGPENQQNSTFVTQLITKIVDNLQITIQNIHVRYEDRISTMGNKPISVGFTLSELSAVSTDENWNEAFLHEEVGVIHKLVRLGSFSAYWNTDAMSLAGMPPEESLKVFMRLIASGDHIPEEHQYILKPVSGQGRVILNKNYKEGQAQNSATLEFDELGFVLDDQQYHSLFLLIGSFSAYLRSQPNAEMLKQLERKLSYNDIRFYRSIAANQMKREKATQGDAEPTLTEVQVQQIMETIEYDEKSNVLDNDLPKEAVLLNLTWKLHKGSFALKKHSRRDADLLSLVFDSLTASITQHPSTFRGDLALGNMTLTDGTTAGTLYPILIQPIDNGGVVESATSRPFFKLEFEHNPIDERADEAVSIEMLPLQVIYNPVSVTAIVNFFTPPATELDTVSTLKNVAQDTLQGLTAQTRAGLEYAIETHRTVDVKVDIAAPIFVFPESCTEKLMVVVIDAGHLLVESNLVSKETKMELERKQGTELSEADLNKLESLLYDRFTCALTSVQALVGPSLDQCLHNAKSDVKDYTLHFIERVDMAFNLEMCILPKLANHVRMAVAGNLPRLHVNLSDRKYKTIMKILDLVSSRSGSEVAVPAVSGNQMEWNFTAPNMADLIVDDVDDSFFDAEETLDAAGPASAVESPNKVLFRFSFEVGQVSASLKKSDKNANLPELSLADLKIAGFDLQFRQRPYDMNVQIKIKTILIEDRMQSSASPQNVGEPRYLLAPTNLTQGLETNQQLVLIEYCSIKPMSSDYKGVDQSVDISFASVDVILVKESILYLYDFVLATFTGGPNRVDPNAGAQKPDPQSDVEAKVTNDAAPSSTMVVRTTMNSINFIINQNGVSIATTSFGAGQLSLTLKQTKTSIAGRLGNLSIVDNVERVGNSRAFKQLLRIEGSEVADFTLDTYAPNDPDYPGYDSSLKLRTASVRLTYIEPLLAEMLTYFKEFARMHVLLDSARRAAAAQEQTGKFHFDLQIETPILEFPDVSLTSGNMISMYLGRISARNEFTTADGRDINEVIADVQALKLVSNFSDQKVESVQMIEDVNIHTRLAMSGSSDKDFPGTQITCSMNEVLLKMTQKQYYFILDILGSISGLTSSPPDVVDIDDDHLIESGEKPKAAVESTGTESITDISLTIPSISLELAEHSGPDGSIDDTSIARFSIISLTLNMTSSATGQELETHVKSLRIWDTRKDSGNLFKEIMPMSSHDEDQLCISVSRPSNGQMNAVVSFDSLRLILVLDHVFAIRDFFNRPVEPAMSDKHEPAPVNQVDTATEGYNAYRVNLVGVEIVLLHNATVEDSEAIILSAKEITYSSDLVTNLSVLEMGMFFCVMNSRQESTLRFIQNFDMTLAMDNRLTAPGHRLTSIYVDISPLMLRVSYRDVSLIKDIVNKATGLTGPSGSDAEKNPSSEVVPASPKKTEDLIMSRERIQVTTKGIRIILIDDLNDIHLPMFDIVVDKLVLEVSDWSSTVSKQEDNSMFIDVYARKKLELNISHVFVETSLNAMALISKQNRVYVPRSHAHSPYILRNKTGYSMHVWAESTGDGLDTELRELANNEEISWRFDDWRAMREISGDKLEFGGRKVSIYSPYVILNKTGLDVAYSTRSLINSLRLAAGQGHVAKSKAGQSVPLVYFNESDARQLCLRLSGLMDEWSSPFNVNQIGQVFIKLRRMGSGVEDLLRAEVMLDAATVFIALTREEGRWPFRVENNSDVAITFWQLESKARYLVPSNESRSYAWDNPSAYRKALMLHIDGAKDREIDVREIGQLVPMQYPVPGVPGKTGIVAIRVYAEGPTLVISLGPYIESKSLFRQGTTKKDDMEDSFQMEQTDLLTFQIKMDGIGISVISREVQEIFYASAKKVDFAYSESSSTQVIVFSIGWLQIDNQLPGTLEPIFLYPTVLPKEGEETYHPVLMATLSKSKDSCRYDGSKAILIAFEAYGVDYYNLFTILLQELSVDSDEDFLYALINFAKFDVAGWEQPEPNLFNSDVSIPSPKQVDGDVRMYFEKFLLQPMQFNISFQRTHTETAEETRGASRNVLTFFFDVFTMTVGNIHGASIKLNALEIYHPIVTLSELVDLMMKFYSQEVVGQLHKFIGSADFLGNPVGLFNNVGSGVRDFFYEPYLGFEITRPQDFGIGLAKGTTSLFKKTVYGLTDTLSKVTASVSKGARVEQGEAKIFVASGITGVLSKPIEGAGKDGVGGFFKGLGKGLVGVVSKPLIGVFDLATNVSEGIRNTTTVFDKELEKIRLPRFISRDGILTPYDPREAQGLYWLMSLDNGKYFHEQYFAHLELKIEDFVVIVTDRRILMAKLRSSRVDWEIPFEDLQLARLDNGGITLIQRGMNQARARIIPCSEKSSAQWLLNRIEIMFGQIG